MEKVVQAQTPKTYLLERNNCRISLGDKIRLEEKERKREREEVEDRDRSLNPVTFGFQRLVYRRRGVVTRATLAYAGAVTRRRIRYIRSSPNYASTRIRK